MQGKPIIKNSVKVVLCILLVIALAAPAAAADAMFRADPQHTGVYDNGGITPTNNKVWRFDTEGGSSVALSPAVANGVVYVGGGTNLWAIDAATGKEKWRFYTENNEWSSPAVANGVVYVGSDNNLWAIDAATGKEKWRFKMGFVMTPPTVTNGVVYVGSYDKNLYAIDASTGNEKWRFAMENVASSSPAVSNSIVYAGSDDYNLYAIDAITGTQKWRFKTGGIAQSSPAVANGVVYVGSGDYNLYAIDAVTGTEKWRFKTGGGVYSSPAVTNGVVYIGSQDGNLYAIDATTGTQKWRFAASYVIFSSPAVANGVVYIGSYDHYLYAIDATTGTQKWRFDTGAAVISSPAVVNGVVYVGSSVGNYDYVYAIGAIPPSPFTVSSITPSTAMNTGAISITDIVGTGFMYGSGVKLTKTGSPDIIATNVVVAPPTHISCTFDLTGKDTGQWNVVVTNPDGTTPTLLNGFTITTSSQTVNFTGSWTMNGAGINAFGDCWGLYQTGSQVTGGYPLQHGRLVGTVIGETLTGYWSDEPTYAPPKDYGWFTVTLGDNMDGHGYSFDGKWGYANSTDNYSFRGARSSTVCPVSTPISLSVTGITPAFGTNDGAISATVTGTGFKPGAVVKLTLTGQPDIVASSVTLTGNSSIACTFDLTGKTTGTWDLAVTNPVDGTTSVRSTAFTITSRYTPNTNGTIIVSSTPPDALVYLDGVLKGTGSVTLQDVSPGYHSVRVSKTMYNDYGTDVRVVAGSPSYVVAVLIPAPGPLTSGTIIASSNPTGANVYLDGMDKGSSPATITNVSSGPHTVSFTKTGYTSASRSITMTAGQTMQITVDLTKTGSDWGDWLNTTTLIIIGIIVFILIIIGVLLRKKKNRWDNY